MKSEIRITDDGSATLFVPELAEHYHSTFGAVQESKHVFIEKGFNSFSGQSVHIFEVGFETGLNALLTLLNSMGKSIVYHAMELNPLSWSTVNELGYHEFLQLSDKHCEKFKLMHMANWEEENKIEPGFILQKFNAF